MQCSILDSSVSACAPDHQRLSFHDVAEYVAQQAPDLSANRVWKNMSRLVPSHVFTNRQHIEWAIEIERVNARCA